MEVEQSVEQVRKDIDTAFGYASMALAAYWCDHWELGSVPRPDEVALSLRYALTFLIANGLVTLAPQEAWERELTSQLPGPLESDLLTLLEQAVQRAPERR